MPVNDALSGFPIIRDKSISLDDKKTYVLGLVFHEICGLEKALGYAAYASTFTLEKRQELDKETKDAVAFIENRDEQCANYTLGELIKECEKIDEFKPIVGDLKHINQRRNFFIHHLLDAAATPIALNEEQHKKLLGHLADLALRMHNMTQIVIERNRKLEERLQTPYMPADPEGAIEEHHIEVIKLLNEKDLFKAWKRRRNA